MAVATRAPMSTPSRLAMSQDSTLWVGRMGSRFGVMRRFWRRRQRYSSGGGGTLRRLAHLRRTALRRADRGIRSLFNGFCGLRLPVLAPRQEVEEPDFFRGQPLAAPRTMHPVQRIARPVA